MCSESKSSAVAEIIEDNASVRIVRYTLAPGAATGWHRHALDYVIVPYGTCRIRVVSADGAIEATMEEEKPYFRERGTEHDVISISDEPISFLEIELKAKSEQASM